VLVSSLDSTVRLLDRSNGGLLQSYKHTGYINTTYRIRSTLTAKDSVVLSGSEDGYIYAWDVVSGEMLQRVDHYAAQEPATTRNSKRVVSAVAQKKRDTEWASASGDGELLALGILNMLRHVCIAALEADFAIIGTIVVWGHEHT